MMTERILLSQARGDFSATVNRVAHKDQRVVLQRNGKDFVAVVPMADLRLIEQLENDIDLAAARKARLEPSISWEEVKKSLKSPKKKPPKVIESIVVRD
jgi:prevent-host-death family protein